MFEKVVMNKHGYYELKNKPSIEEIEKYYQDKYYQEEGTKSVYSMTYTELEVEYFFNKIKQKHHVIQQQLIKSNITTELSLLDVGCGEGWALQYFNGENWNVKGLDYSEFGCLNHNPEMLPNLIAGDVMQSLQTLLEEGQKFSVIWLDNVLEHLLDPQLLLEQCRQLIENNGILVVEVPNDFSILQQELYNREMIAEAHWVAIPDHISYFNRDGLNSLCSSAGWGNFSTLADYPIDFNLFNENTNYIQDRSKGKSCHMERIFIENMLHNISIEKTNEFYFSLANLGLGRQIVGFYKPI